MNDRDTAPDEGTEDVLDRLQSHRMARAAARPATVAGTAGGGGGGDTNTAAAFPQQLTRR